MSETLTEDQAEPVLVEAPQEEVIPEARRVAAIAAMEKLLNTEKGEIAHCAGAMLIARRAYSVLLQSLYRLCGEEGVDPLVPQMIVDMMAERGMRPFDGRELSRQMPQLLAHIKYESAVRDTAEEEQLRQQAAKDEETRRAEELVMPFPLASMQPTRGLPRRVPLLVAAHAPLSRFWLNAATAQLVQSGRRVLRLSSRAISSHQKKGEKLLVEVSRELWSGKLTSPRKIDEVLAPWMRHFRGGVIDALVIDDASLACESELELSTTMTQSKEANKLLKGPFVRTASVLKGLRRWCETTGCGLVLGLPLGTDSALGSVAERFGQQSVSALQNLQEHTCLRDAYSWELPGDRLKLTLGQFVVYLPNTCLMELSDDERRITPLAGDLLNDIRKQRDTLADGARVQAGREHEGRRLEGGPDSEEEAEVAGDGGPTAVHRAARPSLPGGPDSKLSEVCIGGALSSPATGQAEEGPAGAANTVG